MLRLSCTGQPDQSEDSFSRINSLLTPPKTIAPMRPFPTGNASTHSPAGLSYHNFNPSCARADDIPKKICIKTKIPIKELIFGIEPEAARWHFMI